MSKNYSVVVIGGGPAGSTAGTLLRKYNPQLSVLILERAIFPRDHVGESQLPVIGEVLQEMECWDAMERAGFPIKVGATYRWGHSRELWDFDFLPNGKLKEEPRPGKFVGQRTLTAFQVDRSIYDDILLKHSAKNGCEVRQGVGVRKVNHERDSVTSVELETGEEITAKYYIDASGHSGILRRAMGVPTETMTNLQNIAIWDYWQNAEWAVSIGVGGTRIQVLSLGYGWIWFIPLSPTRTSLGLVVPAEYYKTSKLKPRELYDKALADEPILAKLLAKATREDKLATTKDWSFLADRLSGENWFLAGESCGFADPILSAGMTLAHLGARDIAYTILALERRDFEPEWLKSRYSVSHRRHILQHIRFADFWYTQNGIFTDLKEEAKRIAGDAGLNMSAHDAWQWLGTGGFIDHDHGSTGIGGFSMLSTKEIQASFTNTPRYYEIADMTHFALNLDGAERVWGANHVNGRIERHRCYRRDDRQLPSLGVYKIIIDLLKPGEQTYEKMFEGIVEYINQNCKTERQAYEHFIAFMDSLESMVGDKWVLARAVEGFPAANPDARVRGKSIHLNQDIGVGAT